MRTNVPFPSVTHYMIDYSHFGIATLVESVRLFIVQHVWNLFKSDFISSYNKFVASLVGKGTIGVTPPEVLKQVSSLGTEIILKPAVNFDPTGVEPDEMVSPLFWNYAGMNSVLETVMSHQDAIIVKDKIIIYPQLCYVRVNIDCLAVFTSYYEKLDFDIHLLQAFRGLNRLVQLFSVESFVPLPDALEKDFPDVDWSREVRSFYELKNKKAKYCIVDVVKHTGDTKPHFVFSTIPKLTLTSVSDTSEKYGGDRLPEFKTSFNIVVEDYILTSLLCVPYAKYTDVIGGFSFPGAEDRFANYLLYLLYMFLRSLLSKFGIDLSYEKFIEFINLLISKMGPDKDLKHLLEWLWKVFVFGTSDLALLEEFALFLLQAIREFFNVDVPLWHIIGELEKVLRRFEYERQWSGFKESASRTVPLFLVNVMGKCLGDMANRPNVDIIVVDVPENISSTETMVVPSESWRRNPGDYVMMVHNTISGSWELDSDGNVIVKGPLSKGQVIALFVKRK